MKTIKSFFLKGKLVFICIYVICYCFGIGVTYVESGCNCNVIIYPWEYMIFNNRAIMKSRDLAAKLELDVWFDNINKQVILSGCGKSGSFVPAYQENNYSVTWLSVRQVGEFFCGHVDYDINGYIHICKTTYNYTYYKDNDQDGYGGKEAEICATCSQLPGYVNNNIIYRSTSGDCDDNNQYVYPGVTRPCYNACGSGTETCENGRWVNCTAPSPQPEVCNGRDDDCDGKTDEGLSRSCSNACGSGTETCENGRWVNCTAPQPQPEVCNGRDDDCDGKTDEGLSRSCSNACGSGTETCENGQWVNCTAPQPQIEMCNGRDDDCDGQKDEGCEGCNCNVIIHRGEYRTFNDKSIMKSRDLAAKLGLDVEFDKQNKKVVLRGCGKSGSFVPVDQENNYSVTWLSVRQVGEAFCGHVDYDINGDIHICKTTNTHNYTYYKDNDQDGYGGKEAEICATCSQLPGYVNNNIIYRSTSGDCDDNNKNVYPGVTRPCSNACGSGTETCQNGQWVNCTAPQPQPEVCDGKDNDCDRDIDEGLSRSCSNACGSGTETCQNGQWVNCTAPQPQIEMCNGRDDDCDGQKDEGCEGCNCNYCIIHPGEYRTFNDRAIMKSRDLAAKLGLDVEFDAKDKEVILRGCGISKRFIPADQENNYSVTWLSVRQVGEAFCGHVDYDINGDIHICKTTNTHNYTYYKDNDKDGYGGKEAETCATCSQLPGYVNNNIIYRSTSGDCDDNNKNVYPGVTRPCSNACGSGTETCQNGQWVNCTAPQPQPEVCDGKDNDCDRDIDEGCPQTGTISVTTNLSEARFVIVGLNNNTYTGSGKSWTKADVPAGEYSIWFRAVSGYLAPFKATQSLSAGGKISFSAEYKPYAPPIKIVELDYLDNISYEKWKDENWKDQYISKGNVSIVPGRKMCQRLGLVSNGAEHIDWDANIWGDGNVWVNGVVCKVIDTIDTRKWIGVRDFENFGWRVVWIGNQQPITVYWPPLTVEANPKGGEYRDVVKVSLTEYPTHSSGKQPYCTIYYTTDGGDPTTSSSRREYQGPITIDKTTTLKFVAIDTQGKGNKSAVVTEKYELNEFNPYPLPYPDKCGQTFLLEPYPSNPASYNSRSLYYVLREDKYGIDRATFPAEALAAYLCLSKPDWDKANGVVWLTDCHGVKQYFTPLKVEGNLCWLGVREVAEFFGWKVYWDSQTKTVTVSPPLEVWNGLDDDCDGAVDEGIIKLSADLNDDNKIDFADLIIFAHAWGHKVGDKGWDRQVSDMAGSPFNRADIGPYTGTVPNLSSNPDGKVNFEDLMVFAMMWNWYYKSGGNIDPDIDVLFITDEPQSVENIEGLKILNIPAENWGQLKIIDNILQNQYAILVKGYKAINSSMITEFLRKKAQEGAGIYIIKDSLTVGEMESYLSLSSYPFYFSFPGDLPEIFSLSRVVGIQNVDNTPFYFNIHGDDFDEKNLMELIGINLKNLKDFSFNKKLSFNNKLRKKDDKNLDFGVLDNLKVVDRWGSSGTSYGYMMEIKGWNFICEEAEFNDNQNIYKVFLSLPISFFSSWWDEIKIKRIEVWIMFMGMGEPSPESIPSELIIMDPIEGDEVATTKSRTIGVVTGLGDIVLAQIEYSKTFDINEGFKITHCIYYNGNNYYDSEDCGIGDRHTYGKWLIEPIEDGKTKLLPMKTSLAAFAYEPGYKNLGDRLCFIFKTGLLVDKNGKQPSKVCASLRVTGIMSRTDVLREEKDYTSSVGRYDIKLNLSKNKLK